MPRLHELILPLDHPPEALPEAIRARLGLDAETPPDCPDGAPFL